MAGDSVGGKGTEPVDELAATIVRAVENSELGLTIVVRRDEHWQRIYHNEALARILGYSYEELGQLPPGLNFAPSEQERIRVMAEQRLRGEEVPKHFETIVIRPDGTEQHVEVGMATTTYQGNLATVAFIRDIGGRRRMEEELRRSEARFRQLAEEAPDIIAVVQNMRFVYVNRAAASTLGYPTVDDVLALGMHDFLPADEVAMMGDRIRRIRAGEKLAPAQYHGRRADGSYSTVEISTIGIDWQGQPAVLAIGRDLEERNRLQTQLLEADRLAAVGTLAAGVAHEINNPLAYVMLHLERLRRSLTSLVPEPAGRNDTAHAIDEALEGARRVAAIVRDLLSFARSDEENGFVDPVAALESTLRLASTTLKHRARITTDLPPCPFVRGTEGRLGQVFLNLLTNALQAFESDDASRNEVRIIARTEPGKVVVEICDNGRGIPSGLLHRIFDPFFTTKPPGSGTGLGLSISRSIIEGLGGDIGVESSAHEGTRVWVRLPVVVPPAQAARSPAPAPAPRQARLFIVDDEAPLAAALARLLGGNHHTQYATDSRAALARLLAENPFDLVLCDLIMPGLTGWELYEELCAARPEYRERFLFITGGAVTDSASAFLARHDSDVLPKPLDLDALLQRIVRRLGS